MSNTLAVRTSFDLLVKNAQHETIVCTDPCHVHHSPIQDMYGCPYRGHHVALTIDGDFFSVRIDGKPQTDRHDMGINEMLDYIERMTE